MKAAEFASLVTAFRHAVRSARRVKTSRLYELVGNLPRTQAEADFLDSVAECHGIGKTTMILIIEEERGGLGR